MRIRTIVILIVIVANIYWMTRSRIVTYIIVGILVLAVSAIVIALWRTYRVIKRAAQRKGIELREIANPRAFLDEPEQRFVFQAEEFVKRKQNEAKYVPFNPYWPSYDAMDEAQFDWYFYWRDRVRNQEYPETSRAYIYVHAYELINQIGTQNAKDGYEQLLRLWTNYRDVHPEIYTDLLDWIVDYIVVNDLKVDRFAAFATPPIPYNQSRSSADMILASYSKRPLDELPLPIIDALIDYDIQRSKFFQAGHRTIMERTIPSVLAKIDLHLKKNGPGIFERYCPQQAIKLARYAFDEALYAGSDQYITIGQVYSYSTHVPLRQFLTPIVKETENLLRKLVGHRGRLQVKGLEENLKQIIAETVQATPSVTELEVVQREKQSLNGKNRSVTIPSRKEQKKDVSKPLPQVEIDLERVQKLHQESDQVFELLNLEEEVENEVSTGETIQALSDHEGSNVHSEQELLSEPVGEIGEASGTGGSSDRPNREDVTDYPIELTERVISAQAHVEDIDIGDNGIGNQTLEETEFVAVEFEDEGWNELFAELAQPHLDVLRVIVTEENELDKAIRSIATEHGTMPSALIDQVNEFAQDTIGDLLIETDPTPHIIDEEYVASVKRMIK